MTLPVIILISLPYLFFGALFLYALWLTIGPVRKALKGGSSDPQNGIVKGR